MCFPFQYKCQSARRNSSGNDNDCEVRLCAVTVKIVPRSPIISLHEYLLDASWESCHHSRASPQLKGSWNAVLVFHNISQGQFIYFLNKNKFFAVPIFAKMIIFILIFTFCKNTQFRGMLSLAETKIIISMHHIAQLSLLDTWDG